MTVCTLIGVIVQCLGSVSPGVSDSADIVRLLAVPPISAGPLGTPGSLSAVSAVSTGFYAPNPIIGTPVQSDGGRVYGLPQFYNPYLPLVIYVSSPAPIPVQPPAAVTFPPIVTQGMSAGAAPRR